MRADKLCTEFVVYSEYIDGDVIMYKVMVKPDHVVVIKKALTNDDQEVESVLTKELVDFIHEKLHEDDVEYGGPMDR